MRRSVTVAALITLIFFTGLHAQQVPAFEFGVILGRETGVSAKYWFHSRLAADASVAWSFGDVGMLAIHADYVYHPVFFSAYGGELPLYLGVGAGVRVGDDWFVAVRLPVGLEFLFPDVPLSAFAEIAPGVEVLPETVFRLGGGVGLRITLGSR